MHPVLVLQLLLLIGLANAAPVAAKRLLGDRFAGPLDRGCACANGRPLFGSSKTLRGVVLAVLATAAGGALIGLGWRVGALVGAAAMAGDLASSFAKRRLGLPPSSRATGLDQIPEALFPLLASRPLLDLGWPDIAAGVGIFFAAEMWGSRLLHRWGFRDEPY